MGQMLIMDRGSKRYRLTPGCSRRQMLLEEEEVLVSAEGRVDMKRDGWKNTLEDALRLKEMFEREGI